MFFSYTKLSWWILGHLVETPFYFHPFNVWIHPFQGNKLHMEAWKTEWRNGFNSPPKCAGKLSEAVAKIQKSPEQ